MNAQTSNPMNAQKTPSNGWQNTLFQPVEIGGIGVHSGRFIEVVLHPAPAGHGIVFQRSDVTGCDAIIPATIEHAVPHKLCTRIENKDGVGVNTIEHFMAAFHGMGSLAVWVSQMSGGNRDRGSGWQSPGSRQSEWSGRDPASSPRRRTSTFR